MTVSVEHKHSDSLWRWMWIAFIFAHRFLENRLFWWFWNWWYSNAYGEHGVYALIYLAKQHGYPWAQPFGEGEEGARLYLGWKPRKGASSCKSV